MKKFYFLVVLFLSIICHAQDYNGYYITENNEIVKGYFKDSDFTDYASLQFKRSANEVYTKINISNIKEIGIADQFKFEKHSVKMDDTDFNSNRLNDNKEGNWTEKTVFLNVLVEGDASLYSYTDSKGTRYFFKVDSKNTGLDQLVYRKYKVSSTEVSENPQFRQQLYANLMCSNQNVTNFRKIAYKKNDLIEIVKNFNTCTNAQFKVYSNETGKKTTFNYTVFAGLYQSSFLVEFISGEETEKATEISYSVGGEVSFTLPSEKFTFFAKAELEKLNVQTKRNFDLSPSTSVTNDYIFDADVLILNLFLGTRYNFLLNDKNKLYIDGALGISKPFGDVEYVFIVSDASGELQRATQSVSSVSDFYLQLGLGYEFNKKFGIDFRIDTAKNLYNVGDAKGIFGKAGLNLRYTFN